MAATKKEFNKLRERMFLDEREAENYPPFDHDKRFKEKVKENWLTTDEFRNLISANLMELTQVLIDKKMDDEYFQEIMNLVHKKEPFHIGKHQTDYFKLLLKSPLLNLERIYEKYTRGQQYTIKYDYDIILETEILKRKNNG